MTSTGRIVSQAPIRDSASPASAVDLVGQQARLPPASTVGRRVGQLETGSGHTDDGKDSVFSLVDLFRCQLVDARQQVPEKVRACTIGGTVRARAHGVAAPAPAVGRQTGRLEAAWGVQVIGGHVRWGD